MGFKTVYDGERAILISRNGSTQEIIGPRRVLCLLSKLEKLNAHVADLNQYLVVNYVDGRVEHMPGPVSVWFNRFIHQQIRLKNAYTLDESQLIVVYARDAQSEEAKRRLIRGPCVYMPRANEWLHQFKWHTQDKEKQGHLIFSGAQPFEILKIRPDFFHYHVNEVRTYDDAVITVKLMLIYELENVHLMLDKTQDPISDFINFAQFLEISGQKLNQIDTFEQLNQRAARNGCKLVSIIYNGYQASDALQQMQDSAIESRTKLRLQCEIEKQNNELADLKLRSESKRFALENELNKLKADFELKLSKDKESFDLELKRLEHEAKLKLKDYELECLKKIESEKNTIDEEFLKRLKDELEIDLNKYQMKVNKSKNKVDKVYEFL